MNNTERVTTIQLPQGSMQWTNCSDCPCGQWNSDQNAYWCTRWHEHTTQQGCSKGPKG